jgi:erythromycin esterase-like protein
VDLAALPDMADEGMVNIGHLASEKYGEYAAVIIGFGTHRGTVITGQAWNVDGGSVMH